MREYTKEDAQKIKEELEKLGLPIRRVGPNGRGGLICFFDEPCEDKMPKQFEGLSLTYRLSPQYYNKLRKQQEEKLLANLKAKLPQMEQLLEEVDGHWAYEDLIYRYYHRSFKVYGIQVYTEKIAALLFSLAPDEKIDFNADFLRILSQGTGRYFQLNHNRYWDFNVLPMLQAFFHTRYFLEQGIKYAKELDEPVSLLPSGWAGFLYLYNMR